MKTTIFSSLLSVGVLIGCSHIPDTNRTPSSENLTEAKSSCGLKGDVSERIHDCSLQKSSKKYDFVLVTRTESGIEVWKDLSTGFIWSDVLPSRMSYKSAKKACNSGLEAVAGIKGLYWKLPSIKAWREAGQKNIHLALPHFDYEDYDDEYWSSSTFRGPFSEYADYVHTFSPGVFPDKSNKSLSRKQRVRCIGVTN